MIDGPPLQIVASREFTAWLSALRNRQAVRAIARRLDRLRGANFGDHKQVGAKVGELRVDFGPGYRIYYTRLGNLVVVLLCGGDKSSQARDIPLAQEMAQRVEEIIHASRH